MAAASLLGRASRAAAYLTVFLLALPFTPLLLLGAAVLAPLYFIAAVVYPRKNVKVDPGKRSPTRLVPRKPQGARRRLFPEVPEGLPGGRRPEQPWEEGPVPSDAQRPTAGLREDTGDVSVLKDDVAFLALHSGVDVFRAAEPRRDIDVERAADALLAVCGLTPPHSPAKTPTKQRIQAKVRELKTYLGVA